MTSDLELRGIFVPIATPMGLDGTLDERALPGLVEMLIAAGVHGIVTCGGTGEFASLSLDERCRMTEWTLGACDGRIPVIAHTGCVSTRDTITLSEHAAAAGAAAVMVAPPFYDPLSREELNTHYRAVAGAIDVPIVLYNNPATTGVDLTPDIVEALASIDGVRFVKDSSGSAAAIAELVSRVGGRVGIANGADALSLPALFMGAQALIWGVANFVPSVCVRLYELAIDPTRRGDAVELWRSMLALIAFLESSPNVATVKAGCEIVGHRIGPPRAPLLPLGPAGVDRLGELLRGLAVIGEGRGPGRH